MEIPFKNSYLSLPTRFYQVINPEISQNPQLLFFNHSLAQDLKLDTQDRDDRSLAEIFSGNRILNSSTPIALAYAGHQFGYFVPKLGDGRAHLLGEIFDKDGIARDVQLKGSGRTEFSRRGDGRAPLAAVLKEYIISEAMHYLGIPTTRSLAVVQTADNVIRNGIEKSGVLTRVATSHIRIGTFEYFHHRKDFEGIKILADYIIDRHFHSLSSEPNKYELLLSEVVNRQALLVAKWLNIGFVHGVMNTDNISIVGETIDYGPCAFIDDYDINATYSSIDSSGRYSYSNQAAVMQWNLEQLARCIAPLIDNADKTARALEITANFSDSLNTFWHEGLNAKLGIDTKANLKLVQELFTLMQTHQLDYTFVFRQLALNQDSEAFINDSNSKYNILNTWYNDWQKITLQQNADTHDIKKLMLANNPAVIPRNFIIQQAIDECVHEDKTDLFCEVLNLLTNPYDKNADNSLLSVLPTDEQKQFMTFCGT